MDPLSQINLRHTHQSQRAMPGQVKNSAGGFVFQITPMQQVRRFLTIGTTGGTYYVQQGELTKANAEILLEVAKTQHRELVDTIVEISLAGRAPKANQTIFALAVACSTGTTDEKNYALSKLSLVCRTGTHLFLFAKYIEQFRGWGPALRRTVGNWYDDKNPDKLAYQLLKYQQRDGWSHKDLIKLSHPTKYYDTIYRYLISGGTIKGLPNLFDTVATIRANPEHAAQVIRGDGGLSWEMLPTESLNDPEVWKALLDTNSVNLGALIRQLPRLTRLGLTNTFNEASSKITSMLTDENAIRNARIHPINVLVAQATYASGQSRRGSGTWSPDSDVVDALNDTFYKAFGNVAPTGNNTLVGLDISGSMVASQVADTGLSCMQVGAALALVTKSVETNVEIMAFDSVGELFDNGLGYNHTHMVSGFRKLNISPRQRLSDVLKEIGTWSGGRTDCALPMKYAMKHNLPIDTFIVITDNETWHGDIHPYQALQQYRAQSGRDAKLVVQAMTPTSFSIANPEDPGMLDISGFDSATPQMISDFSAGLI